MLKKRFVRWPVPKQEVWIDPDENQSERESEDQEDDYDEGLLHYILLDSYTSHDYKQTGYHQNVYQNLEERNNFYNLPL